MDSKKFYEIVDSTPIIRPIFKITRLPAWMVGTRYARVGDEVFYTPDGCANVIRNGMLLELPASFVKFVEYRNMNAKAR